MKHISCKYCRFLRVKEEGITINWFALSCYRPEPKRVIDQRGHVPGTALLLLCSRCSPFKGFMLNFEGLIWRLSMCRFFSEGNFRKEGKLKYGGPSPTGFEPVTSGLEVQRAFHCAMETRGNLRAEKYCKKFPQKSTVVGIRISSSWW